MDEQTRPGPKRSKRAWVPSSRATSVLSCGSPCMSQPREYLRCSQPDRTVWDNKHSGTTPVDLVLNGYRMSGSKTPFDPLRDALRDHATSNARQFLHLRCEKRSLPSSVISTLIPDDEKVRCSSIESITLRHVDASKSFFRDRFPELWYLDLSSGVMISSREHGLHTTVLKTLSLAVGDVSGVPTTPQLFSTLASNPRIQTLNLSKYTVPRDNGDRATVPVPLRHLKKLSLTGNSHLVFQLLRRLDHPETMAEITPTVSRCTVRVILGILGPYMQDYIRCDRAGSS
jgi:hypothetical protein